MFSQVTEHGRERYSFDPWNKERGEGRRTGRVGETGSGRDWRDRQWALGWRRTDRLAGGEGRETVGYRIKPHEKAALLKGV